MELEFQEIEFHAKKFYKYDRPIFREPYSGVFKPYSDVLELDFPKIEFHAFLFIYLFIFFF